MFVAVSTCIVCAICIVTVRVVDDKKCFGNAVMAAERESCGRGWCKELRARDGACVRVTGVTRDCERWEMRADKRRAYVRMSDGRTCGRRGKPQRMSRRCLTRRFEICSQYLVTVTMPQPNRPCHSQHAYYCAIHLSTMPINLLPMVRPHKTMV
jgi:hypothetical protein